MKSMSENMPKHTRKKKIICINNYSTCTFTFLISFSSFFPKHWSASIFKVSIKEFVLKVISKKQKLMNEKKIEKLNFFIRYLRKTPNKRRFTWINQRLVNIEKQHCIF